MLIQALYNIVDTIYISQYSQDALFAIGLVTPLQMVGLSIALGGGAGVATLVSRRLGEGEHDEAGNVVATGIILTIIHILAVVLLGIFVTKPFIGLFTDQSTVIKLGYDYLLIVMTICFGQHFAILFERSFQAQGNMLIPMLSQLLGALTNIILDPILIFDFNLGIRGAAIATVAGQILSTLFLLLMLRTKHNELKIHVFKHRFTLDRVGDIYNVGLPTMIMNAIGSFTTIMMNNILIKFSTEAVSSLSIYFKVQSFFFMPVFGFSQGAMPILSYNYGANNRKRFLMTLLTYLISAVAIMSLGTIAFRFYPQLVLSFFEMDDVLRPVATEALRTISICFVFAAVSIVMTTMLQSFGRGTISMLQSILRQIVVLIPVAYLLSRFGVLGYVWYAYPIAEILVMLLYIPISIKTYHNHFID